METLVPKTLHPAHGSALAALTLLAACGGSGGDNPPPAAPAELSTTRYDKASAAQCTVTWLQQTVAAQVNGLATRINTAAEVPEGTLNGQPASESNPVLPAHCVVTGTINEHTGAPNDTLYGNNFRLRLPLSWNGRFLFTGGGGNNGSVSNAAGDLRDGSRALGQGFAVVAQDSGHTGSSPTFALDAQAYADFAHESVHEASTISKLLINGYYGRHPHHSYFVGCSNGGREAMVSAQRYDDFDGIVAGAPALNIFDQWMQDVWNLRVAAEMVGVPAGTPPTNTSTAISDAQLAAVSAHFVAKCDALDGATDGLIAHVNACQVTPRDLLDLQCAAQGGNSNAATCLSSAQVAGLNKIYNGPVNSAGVSLFPGFAPGGVETQWRSGLFGTSALGSWYASIIPNLYYFGYGHQGYPGASADPANPASYPTATAYVANFNFDTEPQRMDAGRLQMHGDNVDTTRAGPNFDHFRQRRGKLLIYSGTADASVQAPGLIQFMDKLNATYTAADVSNFARLFFVPGMAHCAGGKSTDTFDQLTPVMKWAELGQAPERIVARANATLDATRTVTRPLCPHPRYAKYQSGPQASADSYVCSE